ncbi:glycosyltransferase family 4 protein [Mariniflexile ostreae]|uniref:Glycosyltransferase family 4 protein n=1 Tax=Mariniflexile ostreae TaxID=1520892 RepID=A0ABV5FC83_9FLAO
MSKQILFIGSFLLPKNGHYGGVYFASTSLRDKMVSEGIEAIELDTTLKDIAVTKVSKRLPTIISRNFYFIYKILKSQNAKTIFIFLSGGNSYLDKLPSIILSKILRKKILLFARSGHLIHDFENPFYKYFIKNALRFSSEVICQSEYWKDFFISKGVPAEKLKTIENWVPNETIIKSEKLTFHYFKPNAGEVFRIVFVSRIEKSKGIADLIEVAKLLPKEMNFKIDVYGTGAFKDEFLELINREKLNELIFYKGWLAKDNMQEILNKYHLALFTSRVEGYPNSLLDFIFSKIPILAYRIPAVVAVGKENILYYDNIDHLSHNIQFSYNNYHEVADNAKRAFKEKYKNNNIDMAFSELDKIQNNEP